MVEHRSHPCSYSEGLRRFSYVIRKVSLLISAGAIPKDEAKTLGPEHIAEDVR